MISLRYHVISIGAVFLALALGVVLGSTALSDRLLSGVSADRTRLEQHVTDLQEDNDALRARLVDAAAFAAGASGVLRKTVGAEEIIDAIRRLCAGDVLLSPGEAIELLRLVDQQREAERTAQRLLEQLTPRERQLLQLLAEGLGDAAMAERLSISPKTVRNHMVRVLDKLGVHSRLQALVLAARHGLVTLG